MIGQVRWFLYKRADSMSGVGNIINWKTNADNKRQIFSEVRDSLMLRRLEIRSIRLIQQMQAIVEDETGWLGAGEDTGANDDLVSALVLAHHVWVEMQRPGLVARDYTWDSINGERPPQNPGTVLSFAFSQHLRAVNRKATSRIQRF
jgi:hypothetical protein